MSANVTSMVSVREVPWHGIGKIVGDNLTAAQALKEAGLDWKVKKVPVFHRIGGKNIEIAGKFAIVRQDTKEALGVVGNSYKPLQNSEAFSFMDAVTGTKEANYETAGCLGGGERVFMLAKIKGLVRVKDTDDTIEKYLLLYNSHNGTLMVNVALTTIRVVCQNTANLAINEAKKANNLFKMRHTKNMGDKVMAAKEQLKLVNTWYEDFNEQINAMADVRMNTKKLNAFIGSLGFDTEATKGRQKATVDQITDLFASGKGNAMKGVKGTLWAAVNGVTEYVDHFRSTRVTDNFKNVQEARLNSGMFGSGQQLKDDAFRKAQLLIAA